VKTEALYSIVYISEHDPNLNENHLGQLDILHNKDIGKHRITGCLTTINGNVVQVLEGEHSIISTLFEKIKLDPKHHNLTIIWSGSIKNRNFSDYNIINFYKLKASDTRNQKSFIELKIQSFLNNHEKNLAQSIFLETLRQMS